MREISSDLREAILARKREGCADHLLVERLVARGLNALEAQQAISSTVASTLQSERKLFRRLRKIEAILEFTRRHRRLSEISYNVPKVLGIDRREFLGKYYAQNRPVLLEGAVRHWPAFSWTVDQLRSRCGSALVEVMTNRNADPRFEVNRDEHRETMLFATFLEAFETNKKDNDWYIVAHNGVLEGPLSPLVEDMRPISGVLGPPKGSHMNLWMGPTGTLTPLHHDMTNVLLVQLMGRKAVHLAPALEIHLLYNDIGGFSDVDPRNIADHFPLAKNATFMPVDLEAGDALFVPLGWWHFVESRAPSISVSCSNFIFENDFPIYNP